MKAANRNTLWTMNPHQKDAWERFLTYSWLPINEFVDVNTPAMQASPRLGASCHQPVRWLPLRGGARSRQSGSFTAKGSGSRRPSWRGGARRGWGHAGGQAEPSHPPLVWWQSGEDVRPSAARGASSPRAIAQSAHTPDVSAAKQNKQTAITALGFPHFDSLWFNFGNLGLSCNEFAGRRKPAPRLSQTSSLLHSELKF